MKTTLFSSFLILALSLGDHGFAQQPAQDVLQQRNSLPGAAGSNQPATLSTSSHSELGNIEVVQEYPVPPTLTVSTTQEVFYTDNVFLNDTNQTGSAAYHGSYYAAIVPYSLRDWTPQISFQYNMFRYDHTSVADFDSATLDFSSKYVFSDDRTWSWTPSVALSRFAAVHSAQSSFYKEITYDNRILHEQKLLPNLYLDTAYNLTYRQTSPGAFSRLDNAVTVGLDYIITNQLVLQPFIRASSYDYVNEISGSNNRNDFNLTSGFELTWRPCKYCSLSGDVIDIRNYSNTSGNTYNATLPGLSVTGTVSF